MIRLDCNRLPTSPKNPCKSTLLPFSNSVDFISFFRDVGNRVAYNGRQDHLQFLETTLPQHFCRKLRMRQDSSWIAPVLFFRNIMDFAIRKSALTFIASETTVIVEIVIGLNCSSCIDYLIATVRAGKCDMVHDDSFKM